MTGSAPAQIRALLILSAKVIITDHWPSPDRCPICNVAICRARGAAVAYLEVVGEPTYIPPIMSGRA